VTASWSTEGHHPYSVMATGARREPSLPTHPVVPAFPGLVSEVPDSTVGAGMLTFTLSPFVFSLLALTVLAVVALLVARWPVRWLPRRSCRCGGGGGPPIARQALPGLPGPAMVSRKGHDVRAWQRSASPLSSSISLLRLAREPETREAR
jgi:hypothetical protein